MTIARSKTVQSVAAFALATTAIAPAQAGAATSGPERIGQVPGTSPQTSFVRPPAQLSDDAKIASWQYQQPAASGISIHDRTTKNTQDWPGAGTAEEQNNDLSNDGNSAVAARTNAAGGYEVVLRDVATGKEKQLPYAAQPQKGPRYPSISDNGRWVAVQIVENNGNTNIFRWNVETNHLTRVSSVKSQPGVGDPQISGDGRKIAFSFHKHTYLRNVGDWKTARLDESSSGTAGNGAWSRPVGVSRTGSSVLFTSTSTNLAPNTSTCKNEEGDTGCAFVRNVSGGKTSLASVLPSDKASLVDYAAISSDGSAVTFGDTHQVYARRLSSGTTKRVSTGADGKQADDTATAGDLNADGSQVVFSSPADNLDGKKCATDCVWVSPSGV